MGRKDKLILSQTEGELLGSQMRHVRETHGLSLTDVAERIGCTKNYLSMIETNKYWPSRRIVEAYQEIFPEADLLHLWDAGENGKVSTSRPVKQRMGNKLRFREMRNKAVISFGLYNFHKAWVKMFEVPKTLANDPAFMSVLPDRLSVPAFHVLKSPLLEDQVKIYKVNDLWENIFNFSRDVSSVSVKYGNYDSYYIDKISNDIVNNIERGDSSKVYGLDVSEYAPLIKSEDTQLKDDIRAKVWAVRQALENDPVVVGIIHKTLYDSLVDNYKRAWDIFWSVFEYKAEITRYADKPRVPYPFCAFQDEMTPETWEKFSQSDFDRWDYVHGAQLLNGIASESENAAYGVKSAVDTLRAPIHYDYVIDGDTYGLALMVQGLCFPFKNISVEQAMRIAFDHYIRTASNKEVNVPVELLDR